MLSHLKHTVKPHELNDDDEKVQRYSGLWPLGTMMMSLAAGLSSSQSQQCYYYMCSPNYLPTNMFHVRPYVDLRRSMPTPTQAAKQDGTVQHCYPDRTGSGPANTSTCIACAFGSPCPGLGVTLCFLDLSSRSCLS